MLKRLMLIMMLIKLEYIERKPSAYLKIWKTKSQNPQIFFFTTGKNWCPPAHLKAQWSDFYKDLNQIKTNENQWRFSLFYIESLLGY